MFFLANKKNSNTKRKRKLVGFRLDEDVRTEFQIYVKRKGTTVQDCLENFVLQLLKNNGYIKKTT